MTLEVEYVNAIQVSSEMCFFNHSVETKLCDIPYGQE